MFSVWCIELNIEMGRTTEVVTSPNQTVDYPTLKWVKKKGKMMKKKVLGCFKVTPEAEQALLSPLAGGLSVIDWRQTPSLFTKISLLMWGEAAVQMILEDADYAPSGWELVVDTYYMKWDRELALSGKHLLVSMTTSNSSRSGRHGDQHVLVIGVDLQFHYAVKGRWRSAASTDEPLLTLSVGGVKAKAIGYNPAEWPDWVTFAQEGGWKIELKSRTAYYKRESDYRRHVSISSSYWEIVSPLGEYREVPWVTGQLSDYLELFPALKELYNVWNQSNWMRAPGPLPEDDVKHVEAVTQDSLEALKKLFKK